MYKVTAITGGKIVPSSIFRIRVLQKELAKNGVFLQELCPVVNRYPPKDKYLRPLWLVAAMLERLTFLYKVKGFDAVILQKELISTLPTLEKIIPGKKIFDVDDAIYMLRKGAAAKNAAEACIGVVCGNDHLAEQFSSWNSNVCVIPTGVDVSALIPNENRLFTDKKVIGWIGTVGNLKYLEEISDNIILAINTIGNSELRIVTSSPDAIPQKLRSYAKFIKWHPGIENSEIPCWSVGIMPLDDNEWTRGKCSFKMLQYLAAGIPVVASPVGMNNKILGSADLGHAAINGAQWEEALIHLLSDEKDNRIKGLNGRNLIEKEYSHVVVAKKWKETLDLWL